MALKIVAESPELPGITKGSRNTCDTFTGSKEDLIAAGVITESHLRPQPGRPPGRTAFLPDGSICPPSRRAWAEEGYLSIRLQLDGRYLVERTVSKEIRQWRWEAENAKRREENEARINREIGRFTSWSLTHDYGGCYESWVGTKSQLQSVGLGIGMTFPGESGRADKLHCKCPLGFDFEIALPEYDSVKAAAGIYEARSSYLPPRPRERDCFEPFAPGVTRQVSGWRWHHADLYVGSAQALLLAGIVPSLALFPGQPGANKTRCTYRTDWTPATCSPHCQELACTIIRRGVDRFGVEVPLSDAERARRDAIGKEESDRKAELCEAAARERRELREGTPQARRLTERDFRDMKAREAEGALTFMWNWLIRQDGSMRLDLSEGTEARDQMGEAFQMIRDAIRNADITVSREAQAAARQRLKVVAARSDVQLQSVLRDAASLRLVHSRNDDQSEGA